MARSETPKRRCAIYTRKSSEEGLEQEFNSLHAQREACEAYIRSQRHEGWVVIPTAYDDGGFSGGTMQRPGLPRQPVAEARKVAARPPPRLGSHTMTPSAIPPQWAKLGTSCLGRIVINRC